MFTKKMNQDDADKLDNIYDTLKMLVQKVEDLEKTVNDSFHLSDIKTVKSEHIFDSQYLDQRTDNDINSDIHASVESAKKKLKSSVIETKNTVKNIVDTMIKKELQQYVDDL